MRKKVGSVTTGTDNLTSQIIQEKTQLDELTTRATELRNERAIKERKLHEMASKVKSKNQQVFSLQVIKLRIGRLLVLWF